MHDEFDWGDPDDAPEPVGRAMMHNDMVAADLGRCCVCMMKGPDVRNVLMLPYKSLTPGFGWGCFQCGLPPDGAVAVVCDDCLGREVRFVVVGYPYEDRRVSLGELEPEKFEHDLSKHPEAQEVDGEHGSA